MLYSSLPPALCALSQYDEFPSVLWWLHDYDHMMHSTRSCDLQHCITGTVPHNMINTSNNLAYWLRQFTQPNVNCILKCLDHKLVIELT